MFRNSYKLDISVSMSILYTTSSVQTSTDIQHDLFFSKFFSKSFVSISRRVLVSVRYILRRNQPIFSPSRFYAVSSLLTASLFFKQKSNNNCLVSQVYACLSIIKPITYILWYLM